MSLPAINFDLAVRRRQLIAYYQPVVDINSGFIEAIEARVRWENAPKPPVSARGVLQAAAVNDAYGILDGAVIDDAVGALARLSDEHLDHLRIAVNLSSETCTSPRLMEWLEVRMNRPDIDPTRWQLEIPSRAFLTEPEEVIDMARRMADRGFRISIDHVDVCDEEMADIVNRTPLHSLVLDEQLASRVPEDFECADRIKDIVKLARSVGKRVETEGLVRVGQLGALKDLGCNSVRGDLISRPRPLGDLMFLLKKGRCW